MGLIEDYKNGKRYGTDWQAPSFQHMNDLVGAASNAQDNAVAANTKATTAESNSSIALQKATTAETNSTNAVNTANNANTKSDTANTKADNANTKSDNAVSTANSANTKATNAEITVNNLTQPPDVSEANKFGVVNVEIIGTETNDEKFKFSNLKGNGIATIAKTGSNGLQDIYTITFDNDETFNFNVTNGKGITNISKTNTSGLVDTYTITYNDESTSIFTITNGDSIELRVEDGYFQWKYTTSSTWNNLISLGEITSVDQELSTTSTNAVANKPVTEAINKLLTIDTDQDVDSLKKLKKGLAINHTANAKLFQFTTSNNSSGFAGIRLCSVGINGDISGYVHFIGIMTEASIGVVPFDFTFSFDKAKATYRYSGTQLEIFEYYDVYFEGSSANFYITLVPKSSYAPTNNTWMAINQMDVYGINGDYVKPVNTFPTLLDNTKVKALQEIILNDGKLIYDPDTGNLEINGNVNITGNGFINGKDISPSYTTVTGVVVATSLGSVSLEQQFMTVTPMKNGIKYDLDLFIKFKQTNYTTITITLPLDMQNSKVRSIQATATGQWRNWERVGALTVAMDAVSHAYLYVSDDGSGEKGAFIRITTIK